MTNTEQLAIASFVAGGLVVGIVAVLREGQHRARHVRSDYQSASRVAMTRMRLEDELEIARAETERWKRGFLACSKSRKRMKR